MVLQGRVLISFARCEIRYAPPYAARFTRDPLAVQCRLFWPVMKRSGASVVDAGAQFGKGKSFETVATSALDFKPAPSPAHPEADGAAICTIFSNPNLKPQDSSSFD
jgi:hypothetical protein